MQYFYRYCQPAESKAELGVSRLDPYRYTHLFSAIKSTAWQRIAPASAARAGYRAVAFRVKSLKFFLKFWQNLMKSTHSGKTGFLQKKMCITLWARSGCLETLGCCKLTVHRYIGYLVPE